MKPTIDGASFLPACVALTGCAEHGGDRGADAGPGSAPNREPVRGPTVAFAR